MSCGIMVGSDKEQQDLLPFWWVNFRLHNHIPVTFCDFGMDEWHLDWCRERGEVISLSSPLTDSSKIKHIWFKKPLAISLSPYDKTLWIDTDCIIRGNLLPLFDYCDNKAGIAMVREPDNLIKKARHERIISEDTIMYNSGVIVVKRGCEILQIWKEACINFESYRGDQEILSDIMHLLQITPACLPDEYNWIAIAHKSLNKDSQVLHLAGKSLKPYLRIFRDYLFHGELDFTNFQ